MPLQLPGDERRLYSQTTRCSLSVNNHSRIHEVPKNNRLISHMSEVNTDEYFSNVWFTCQKKIIQNQSTDRKKSFCSLDMLKCILFAYLRRKIKENALGFRITNIFSSLHFSLKNGSWFMAQMLLLESKNYGMSCQFATKKSKATTLC